MQRCKDCKTNSQNITWPLDKPGHKAQNPSFLQDSHRSMKRLLLTLILATIATPALADTSFVPTLREEKQKNEAQQTQPDSKASSQASPKLARNDDGHVTIDGETYGQRNPEFEKYVAKPFKYAYRPIHFIDVKTGFHKLRHMASDAIIVAGAKYKPYEPASAGVITGSQIVQMIVRSRN